MLRIDRTIDLATQVQASLYRADCFVDDRKDWAIEELDRAQRLANALVKSIDLLKKEMEDPE